MKKIYLILPLLLGIVLTGCGKDTLVIKSNSYGVESKVVVYFTDGIATKAVSKTKFATEKEAIDEYNKIKDIQLNAKLDKTTVTYEQKDFFKGKTKDQVKKMFQELDK